jgi:hypothetical protein
VSDQQQILRLLATIREEVADIRTRQEELYEVLVSYKDQLHNLDKTVQEGLRGLPSSPYIAGQLVPAPDHIGGVDDFRQLIATYLHGPPPPMDGGEPVDVVVDPPAEVKPEEIELEPDEDRPKRRSRSRGQRADPDLSRGPERDVVPLDLDDEPAKKKKKRRRRSRSKKKSSKVEATDD